MRRGTARQQVVQRQGENVNANDAGPEVGTDEEVEGFVEGGAIGRGRPEGLGVDMYNAQQHPEESGRVGRLDHAQHLPPIGSGEY